MPLVIARLVCVCVAGAMVLAMHSYAVAVITVAQASHASLTLPHIAHSIQNVPNSAEKCTVRDHSCFSGATKGG